MSLKYFLNGLSPDVFRRSIMFLQSKPQTHFDQRTHSAVSHYTVKARCSRRPLAWLVQDMSETRLTL